MAKRRSSTAHLAPYQFRPQAPIVVTRTRVVKQKPKRRRRSGGGGGGLGLGALIAAELALQVAEPMILGMLAKSGMGMGVPQPILMAGIAHFAHADKYVKGVQLLTKIKAVESVLGGGVNLFGQAPQHG